MPGINRWWRILALGLVLTTAAHAEQAPLRIGIIPYLTPSILINLFQPIRQHLEMELGQSVELYTAPDVRSFAKRTLKPDFDILITAAHQARLAQIEGGYLPGVRFNGPLHASILVANESPNIRLEDLKGRRIAITDRSILVNIATLKILADRGIAEQDLTFIPVNSQNSAILSVARHEADAAIIAHFALDQSPAEQRNAVRAIYQSVALPNVMLMLSPKLESAQRKRIIHSLLNLPQTPDGAHFLEKSRFGGIQTIEDAVMKSLDVYQPETRKQLGL